MNESLDLRNRILKMRESNNFTVTKAEPLTDNLMSDFENSIKDDQQIKSNFDKDTVNDKKAEGLSKSNKINSENLFHHKDETENQNIIRNVDNNDAQFLMLANKFNEAVEVILELSNKVEKLERNALQNKHMQKNKVKSSSYFNFKMLVFLLLIPITIVGYLSLPFDYLHIKSIIVDILSSL